MFKSNRELRRDGALPLVLVAPLLFFAWIFAWVSGAGASEVVDLRVGSHPEYTRIVFELDTPTGYRIERASPEPGIWELIVAIDATSIPRKIQSTKSLIGLVRIQPEGDRSIAHIRLTRSGLRLKEMILSSPPRIVLDVLAPPGSAKSPTARKEPKPSPPPVVAKAPAPKPAAKPSPVTPPGEPKPAVLAAAEPRPSSPSFSPEPPGSAPEPSEGGIPSMGMKPEKLAASPPSGPPGGAQRGSKPRGPRDMTRPAPLPGRPPASSARASRMPTKKLAKKLPPAPIADSPSSGMGTLGVGLAVVGGLALVAFVVLRRRRAAAADEAADDGFEDGAVGDGNPFSGLTSQDDGQPVLSTAGSPAGPGETATQEMEIGGMEEEPGAVDFKKAEPALEGAGMELGGAETVVTGIGSAPPIGGTGVASELGGSEEEMRMIREFERRLASMETRLDEVVDARERLERQVAAQTEELRVQRAAIARTQRAVRNLSRPEEEGPTEPAPRDPS